MGYRKSKETARTTRRWKHFIREYRNLIDKTGLPLVYIERMDMFEDFLMHGYIDHHDDSAHFNHTTHEF